MPHGIMDGAPLPMCPSLRTGGSMTVPRCESLLKAHFRSLWGAGGHWRMMMADQATSPATLNLISSPCLTLNLMVRSEWFQGNLGRQRLE